LLLIYLPRSAYGPDLSCHDSVEVADAFCSSRSTINQLRAAGSAQLHRSANSAAVHAAGWAGRHDRNPGADPAETEIRRAGVGGETMLYYALVFFIIAVIAGLLGFGVIASAAAGIAKILFFVFLVLFIVTLIGHASRGRAV
jgi:uncharacterized membrane protein YtjA (UPF0391 family)